MIESTGNFSTLDGVVSVLAKDVRGLNEPALIEGESSDFIEKKDRAATRQESPPGQGRNE